MRRRGLVLVALASVLGIAPAPAAPGRPSCPIANPPVSHVAGNSRAVAVADVTGDGRNDLIESVDDFGSVPASLLVYEQHSTGRFDAPRPLPVGEQGGRWMDVAVADLDGDARSDLAVGTINGVVVFLASEGFGTKHFVETSSVSALAAAHLDGDGRADLAVGTQAGIYVVRNAAAGQWSASKVADEEVRDVATGDVSGDGRVDIAATPEDGLLVLVQEEGGTFGRVHHPTEGRRHARIAIGDLTDDEKADVAYAGQDGFSLFAQTPDGRLEKTFAANRGDGPITIADWGGTSENDLIYSPSGMGKITVFVDGYDGSAAVCDYALPIYDLQPDDLAIGDLTGDSLADAVVNGATLVAQRSTPLPVPRAVLIRRVGPRKVSLGSFAMDETGMDQAYQCPASVAVERFTKGKWRREAGPVRAVEGRTVRISGKPGPYRAVLQPSRVPGDRAVVCTRATSAALGDLDELRRVGCPSAARTKIRLPWGANDLVQGDFNGDGRRDVAVSGVDYDADPRVPEFVVYHGTDGGRLGNARTFRPDDRGGAPPGLVAGDFNGDGADDVAVQESYRLRVFLQQGGMLTDGPIVDESWHHYVFSGDVNADGSDDLLTSDLNLGQVLWYGPDLSEPVQVMARGSVVPDVNGDDLPDMDGGGSGYFAYQYAPGAFSRFEPYVYEMPVDLDTTGDLNGDGHLDMVSAWMQFGGGIIGRVVGAIGVRYSTEGHGFGPLRLFSVTAPSAVEVGDVTGDGRADLLIGDHHGLGIMAQSARGELGPLCHLIPFRPHRGVGDIEIVDLAGDPVVVATYSKELLLLRLR